MAIHAVYYAIRARKYEYIEELCNNEKLTSIKKFDSQYEVIEEENEWERENKKGMRLFSDRFVREKPMFNVKNLSAFQPEKQPQIFFFGEHFSSFIRQMH